LLLFWLIRLLLFFFPIQFFGFLLHFSYKAMKEPETNPQLGGETQGQFAVTCTCTGEIPFGGARNVYEKRGVPILTW
jgi:hypothetical protein